MFDKTSMSSSSERHLHLAHLHTYFTLQGDNQFGNWYTWVTIICFLTTAGFWVTRLNKVQEGGGGGREAMNATPYKPNCLEVR